MTAAVERDEATGAESKAEERLEARYFSGRLSVGLGLVSTLFTVGAIALVGRTGMPHTILAAASTSLFAVWTLVFGVPVRVRREGDALVHGLGRLPMTAVEKGALLADRGRPAVLLSRRRSGLRVVVPDEAAARALLAQAGVSQDQRRMELPLSKPTSTLIAMTIALLVALPVAGYATAGAVWALVSATSMFEGTPPAGAFWSVLLGAAASWLLLSYGLMRVVAKITEAPELTIGDDAITVRGFRQNHDIPLAEVVRTRVERRGLAIEKKDGRRVRVRLGLTGDPQKLAAAASGIAYALKRRTEPRGDERLPVTYLRGGRGVREWLTDLRRRLGEGRGEYRQAEAPSDVFRGVIERTDPDREELIGAALGLRIAAPEEASARLRVAARRIAAPELRAALLAIAEDGEAEAETEAAIASALAVKRS